MGGCVLSGRASGLGSVARGPDGDFTQCGAWQSGQTEQPVNGTRTGQFGFHTDLEDRPWWEVDLGRPLAIGEIRIFNRLDVGAERSRSLNVLLSSDGVSWRTVHDQEGRVFGGLDGRPLRIFPAAQEAQFVRVQLTERQYLHLDQVEVYEPLGEVAKVPPDSDEPTPEDGTAGSRRSPT